MKFGCCLGLTTFMPQKKLSPPVSAGSLFVNLVQMLETLEQNGFDYVEAEVGLVAPLEHEGTYATFKKALRTCSLKPEVFSAFIPRTLAVVGPDVDQSAIQKYLQVSTSRVAESGGEIIIWGSGASRSYPEDFPREKAYAQIVEFLQKAAEFCRMNGILVAIDER